MRSKPTATSPGDPSITTLTTGSATGKLLNANGIEGNNIEPPMISGAIVSCQQVGSGGGTSGSSLVGSFTATGGETTGDYVVTDAFVSQ